MSTKKRCAKSLKKDKSSGKCVSVKEFNDRKKRSKTLKKIDKMNKKIEIFDDKIETARKTWDDNIEYKKNNTETSESNKRHKKLIKLTKEKSKITVLSTNLEKCVGDIEEKYKMSQSEPY